jgi:protein MpaA
MTGTRLIAAVVAGLGLVALTAAFDRKSPIDRLVSRSQLLTVSVHGRPIKALERGDPDAPRRELIVGCIHGNEQSGIAIAEAMETLALPKETALWVVENSNPDGAAAGTRTNGDGVDLNRNFPWRWRKFGSRGDPHYTGPRPLSEPESRALAALIRRVRPTVTIWFHQPLGLVDESGGSVAVERRYASLVGLPLRRLPRYRGGVTNWQNQRFRPTSAFVLELPPGSLSGERALAYGRAALRLLAG